MNLSMISNYVKSKWSKGVGSKKIDVTTKDIRLLGCFGNGDDIAVCPALRPSEVKMGKFLCNECGCGDKATSWLNGTEQEYTKLDHPYLSCPRKMPGFSDYEPSTESDDVQETRKRTIELILGDDILSTKNLIKPEMSPEEQKKNNEKPCPSCETKTKVRQEIVDKLKAEGLEANFKDVKFNTRFRKLWFEDERIKKIISEEQQGEGKKGCPSCERKRQLRQEVALELADSGLEGTELANEIAKIAKERFRKEQSS